MHILLYMIYMIIIYDQFICLSKKICNVCNQVNRSYHVCGENAKWCTNWKKSDDNDHKYFIKADKIKESSKKIHCLGKKKSYNLYIILIIYFLLSGWIIFDYEAQQINNVHGANLIVAEKIFKACIDGNKCFS